MSESFESGGPRNGEHQRQKKQENEQHGKDEISYIAVDSAPALNGASYAYSATDPDEVIERGPPLRPLTPLRVIRGILCLFVLIFTAFMMLVGLAPILCVFVRLVSVHYSRKSVAFFFGHWLSMWPFLFENINQTKVIFSGDKVPAGERVIAICNHRTEVDWMYLWNLALRKSRIGYVNYVVKSSVRNVPIFGWALYAMEFLLIERRWDVDEPIMNDYLASFEDPRDPLWLILFPEGTDYTERKKLAGQEFAAKRGLPKLNHVLMPRTRGFLTCIAHLRSSLDAVYDLTIAYKNNAPLFIDNLFGIDPAEVHIHIRRVPVEEVPTSEEECSKWLYATYERKDDLLALFKERGYFSYGSIEDRISTGHMLLSFSVVTVCTLLFWYLTFFCSIWPIRLYFGLSCIYLSTATYLGWRPGAGRSTK